MRTIEDRNSVRELRTEGWSIKQIEKHLGIARSTISGWVKDIELTPEQMRVLSERKAVQYIHIKNEANRKRDEAKIKRELDSETGKKRCGYDLSFRLVCALYWGEGTKNKNTFAITNCSPDMLRVVGEWLIKEGFKDRIRFGIGYHSENGVTENEIKCYWMNELKWLLPEHICKMTVYGINRASQRRGVGKQPFGTARVSVHSTKLASMISGGIEYLKEMGL